MDCKIIQWNCRSIVPKKHDLIYLLNKHSPVVVALSETWLKPGYLFKVPGYTCLRDDRYDGYGGVALLVRNSIDFSRISFSSLISNDAINIVGIKIYNISIVSIYLARSSFIILNSINNLLSSLSDPFLLLGDFNCHHQMFGCGTTDTNGVHLVEILDLQNLCLLNTGSPTRRTKPNEKPSAVDLSICTPDLASSHSWYTSSSTFGSDHFPIIISSPIRRPPYQKREPRVKYKLNNADWSAFKNLVESKIKDLPELVSGGETNSSRALATCLIESADQIFSVKRNPSNKIPYPPWWDRECMDAVSKRKVAERVYAEDMSNENLDILNEVICITRKFLRDKKQEGWKTFCTSLSPSTCPTEVWRSIKRFRSAFKESLSSSSLPPSLTNAFLDRLAPPSVDESIYFPLESSLTDDSSSLNSPFSLHELKGVLSHVKDSSPGQDGIMYSFLSHLGNSALMYFLNLINSVMVTGNIPETWKSQEVIAIKKPNKPTNDVASYRPIALSSVLTKVAEHLVKNRLEWFIENNNFIANSQYGFRKSKSTIDNLAILTTDIRLAFSRDEDIVAAFLDIAAAYDNVNISILQRKLLELQVPTLLIHFIINLLSCRYISLFVQKDGNTTELKRTVFKGLPQGSVLSPLLYNIYTYDLESSLYSHINVLQYADDLLFYSVNKSIDIACNFMSNSLNSLNVWLVKNDLNLSVSKSSIVVFSKKRTTPIINVTFNGQSLPFKTKIKFLGVILDSKLSGLAHYEHIDMKCAQLLNIMKCLSGVWWGAHPFSMKLVYNALVRSVLDYGTFLLDGGSVLGSKKLDVIQSKALRIVTGVMKSCPTNALQVECCDPPLKLRRQFLSDRYLFKSMQFSDHTLHGKLHELNNIIQTSRYWRHKSLPCLIKSFRKFLTIHSHIHRSPSLSIFMTQFNSLILAPDIRYDIGVGKQDILETNIRFMSSVEEQNWSGWDYIFTDASKISIDDCVGVGLVHWQHKIIQKIKLPPESSVFTGECFALLKAVELVILLKSKRTIIFSDSKSALRTIEKFPFQMKPCYPIICEIRDKLLICSQRNHTIIFAWIPSHCGIKGNEKADQLAKEAIKDGDIVPYINYCHDLTALPKTYLWESWNDVWLRSSKFKGKLYAEIQPTISSKPWFFKAKSSKIVTSIISRMRLGHVCTPHHLARLRIVDSNICECGEDIGDLDHIFFSCSQYDRTSFMNSLQLLQVPFPTKISCLLLYPLLYYNVLSSFIINNNIKI